MKTFKDRSKLALLAFLIPIVEHLERINAMFQVTFVSILSTGDGRILLQSNNLQRNTSTKIKIFGTFSQFLCIR
jgi:hypothetical protein